MFGITLSKAITVFENEIGCSSLDEDSRDTIIDLITRAVEWLLFNGGGNILREWQVVVRNGVCTLPRDLGTPVKYKVGRHAHFGYGPINDAYFSYGSQGVFNMEGFFPWSPVIAVKPQHTVVQFYPPKRGVRLIATANNHRDVGKSIVVGGKQRGFNIVSNHYGKQISGESLKVYDLNDPDKKYSAYTFDEITHVVKDRTCDYIMLSGISENGEIFHLAHYHPDDEIPSFTELDVSRICPDLDYILHILGRVSPSIRYVRDQDILPINSYEILDLLATRAKYSMTKNFQELGVTEQRLQTLIRKQLNYNDKASSKLSFDLTASGATLSNL